ncbi:MAG: DUF1156 domain-containing protein [Clostridiales bacterium]|nr:DUF1156 domain-containing protein [Clostridiales bacterium]
MAVKKLIEVALPLEKINAESAREKSIRHGHPSTLHLWWARRPLAAARAVIWSSLVDDPSSHPDLFPTEEDQNKERQRLFGILEKLVVWENSNNEDFLNAAKAEIMKYTNNDPPALLDPFAGGGAIPLEAQRLGLEAHAHDLNPVAVMINKAMIEIPPRFADMAPVSPDSRRMGDKGWKGAAGLAEDVRYYGEWMKQEAFKRIGHLYPKVKVPAEQGGGEATVIAWIWARTVKCPNPACGCEMPLANSFTLSKKKGKEAYIKVSLDSDTGKTIYSVTHNPQGIVDPKTGKGQFKCVLCDQIASKEYIHEEFKAHKNSTGLMAVVAEGVNGRLYLSPDDEQRLASDVDLPDEYPDQEMNQDCTDLVSGRGYGFTQWSQLFTPRQLTALTTFSDLVSEAQKKAEADAVSAGMADDHIPLSEGGKGALAYGQAVGVYLAFTVDKMSDRGSTICGWDTQRDGVTNTFGRQAIPMKWDYAESNPFSNSSGCFDNTIMWINKCLVEIPASNVAFVKQADAQSDCGLRDIMISTDPPYYDNIGYADLSDYFYIWLRRSLKNTYPMLFSTMLVPKAEELIATPYRHEGSMEKASEFFESGMLEACNQLYRYASDSIPVTIYYAYKQNNTDIENEEQTSTGWETMLTAVIHAGFSITGTWPMRTELTSALKNNVNALASSIVLVCRKRSPDAPVTTRRNFINELKRELRPALKKLQSSNIAPVDLQQSAIGPGMGIFSRYSKVLEADGTPMSVRSALIVINQELDHYFNDQDSDLDSESRFCVELYMMSAFNDFKSGDAILLAQAKGTTLETAGRTVYAKGGKVHLIERPDLPEKINAGEKCVWLLCQQLAYRMEKEGVEGCAKAVADMFGSTAESAKELAYRLYTVADKKNWTNEAYAYNNLVVAWPDILSRAAEMKGAVTEQIKLDI